MAVNIYTHIAGSRRVILTLANDDGTAETGAQKLDISTLLNGKGEEPSKVALEEVSYDIHGFDSVTLATNRTSNGISIPLSGQGYLNWRGVGFLQDAGTGGTGDLELTTAGTGGGYTITVVVRVK